MAFRIMIKYLEKLITDQINTGELQDRYKFNCIYCKDRDKSAVLYKDSNIYHCFKCGTHKNSVSLLNDFNISVSEFEYDNYLTQANEDHLYRINNSTLNKLSTLAVEKEKLMLALNAKDIRFDTRAKRFIKNKGLSLFSDYFAVTAYNAQILMFNLTRNKNVLGYWVIDLKDFGKIKEFVNLQKCKKVVKQASEYPRIYDQLSGMLNILNINISKIVTIFDDVINSLFYPNSIFINANYHFFNDIDTQYMFAYNNHGINLYNEKKICGEKVFNWDGFFDSNLDLKRRKIYDLHDLKLLENKINKKYKLVNYFN